MRLCLCCRLAQRICCVAQPAVRRLELQNTGGPCCESRLGVGRQAGAAAGLQQRTEMRCQRRSRLNAHVFHGYDCTAAKKLALLGKRRSGREGRADVSERQRAAAEV